MQRKAARADEHARPASRTAQLATSPLGVAASALNAAPRVQGLLAMRGALSSRPAPVQCAASGTGGDAAPAAGRPDRTGQPHGLKARMEALSGLSLDNVRVRYNSPRPARLQAHAFAQGTDIHLAPGQQHHLPHEAWHVVQQAQGRVRPTIQMAGGTPVNDDAGLEREADIMGARAARGRPVI